MKKIIYIIAGLALSTASIAGAANMPSKTAANALLKAVGQQTGSKEIEILLKEQQQAKQGKKLTAKEKQAQQIQKIDAEISDLQAGKIKIQGVIKQLKLTGDKKTKMEKSIKNADERILKLKADRAKLTKQR